MSEPFNDTAGPDSQAEKPTAGKRWVGPAGIGWRGLLLIFGFWTLFGIVMAASLLLSPFVGGRSPPSEVVAFTFLGAYTWAALTLPLFAVTGRFHLGGERRAAGFIALCLFGLLLAVLVSGVIAYLSSLFLQESLAGELTGPEGVWRLFRYRVLNDVLACLLVLSAGVARDYFFQYQARREEATRLQAQLVESRLEVLRTQLNPHFLFNTLNAVSALVTKDPKGVRRMIARLAELLRYTLDGSAEPEITLAREIDFLRQYLEIVEIRYQGRLRTRVAIAPDAVDALVPNLILQPLAENAMKHGVSQTGGHGMVEIEGKRSGDELVLTVRDTGDGVSPSAAERDAEGARAQGFGLRHTEERLRQLYGDAYSLVLSRNEAGGTTAEIRLPYHTRSAPAVAGATPRAEVPTHA